MNQQTHHKIYWKKFDYIFCWAWASASLCILKMYREWCLENKNILLIDKEKELQDKSFCFWSLKNDPITHDLDEIISHSWETNHLGKWHYISTQPYTYHHIRSKDLYASIQKICSEMQVEQRVWNIRKIDKDGSWTYIELEGEERIYWEIIFDSRTAKYQASEDTPIIFQSFIGWRIKTQQQHFDPKVFTLMDFEVRQSGGTQFAYILPYSDTEALIELTRFWKELISISEADEILEQYIKENFGTYQVYDIERWCIAMTQRNIITQKIPWVYDIGARNYNIKASTGYAFKKMYHEASQITEHIKRNNLESIASKKVPLFKKRFYLYDTLLLDILSQNPQYGKKILSKFISSNKIQNTLKFLDEETHIWQEISIFWNIPWTPFLLSLCKKIIKHIYFHPIFLLLLSLLLILAWAFTWIQSYFGYTLLFLGFLSIGIPHWAVDHLIETKKWNNTKILSFILYYLILMLLIVGVWVAAPEFALILFLVYSMWHFGQTDGKIWGFSNILSFAWWASLLIFILATHKTEANMILENIWSISVPFELPFWSLLPWVIFALYTKNILFSITLLWLTLTSFIPLLFAFWLYFIGQHSYTWWRHIQVYLKKNSAQIWIQAFPYHASAWVMLGLFSLFWPNITGNWAWSFWWLFFIFISCISFPHVIVMSRMYYQGDI